MSRASIRSLLHIISISVHKAGISNATYTARLLIGNLIHWKFRASHRCLTFKIDTLTSTNTRKHALTHTYTHTHTHTYASSVENPFELWCICSGSEANTNEIGAKSSRFNATVSLIYCPSATAQTLSLGPPEMSPSCTVVNKCAGFIYKAVSV